MDTDPELLCGVAMLLPGFSMQVNQRTKSPRFTFLGSRLQDLGVCPEWISSIGMESLFHRVDAHRRTSVRTRASEAENCVEIV